MSVLAKLNLKTVHRNVKLDPVMERRQKLVAALEEQSKVLAAALAGNEYTVKVKRWQTNDEGERIRVEADKLVRRWFFEQDGGWYVQCRYGSRILMINGRSNAVFVSKLDEAQAVFDAFKAAAESGEFDKAIVLATKARAS